MELYALMVFQFVCRHKQMKKARAPSKVFGCSWFLCSCRESSNSSLMAVLTIASLTPYLLYRKIVSLMMSIQEFLKSRQSLKGNPKRKKHAVEPWLSPKLKQALADLNALTKKADQSVCEAKELCSALKTDKREFLS